MSALRLARLEYRYGFWAATIAAWGIALRIGRWSSGLSLSTDELFIGVNLQRRGFGELQGTLDYDQVAPAGWLWLEKLAYLVSRDEMVLRLPALLSGCGLIVAMAVLARRLLPGPVALAVLLLAAGNPELIYWSNQVKPYSIEAAATVVLLLLAVREGSVAPFWITASVLPWFGATAVFGATAIGGALVGRALLSRRWVLARRHALAGVPFVVSVLGVYLTAPPVSPWVYDFWSGRYPWAFAPPTMDFPTWRTWSGDALVGLSDAMGAGLSAALVWVFAAGAVALAVRRPAYALLVCAPFVVAYLLAWLRVYPFAGRAALWVLPVGFVLVGCSMEGLVHAGRQLVRRLVLHRVMVRRVAAAGVAYAPAVTGIVVIAVAFVPRLGVVAPDTAAERYAIAEDAIRYIAADERPGDRVYFRDSSAPLALWYGPLTGLRWDGVYTTAGDRRCHENPAALRPDGVERIWLVLRAWGPGREALMDQVRTMMLRYGLPVRERSYGVFVVLLNDVSPPEKPPRGSHCLLIAPTP